MGWREKQQADLIPVMAKGRQEIVLNALLGHPSFNGVDMLHNATCFVGNKTDEPVRVDIGVGVITTNGIQREVTIYPVERNIDLIKRCHAYQLPSVLSSGGPQYSVTFTNLGDKPIEIMLMLTGVTWSSIEL